MGVLPRPVPQVEGSDLAGLASLGLQDFLRQPRDEDSTVVVNSEESEGESNRRKALFASDPVNRLQLSAFCKEQFERAAVVHGPALNAALNAIDPVLTGQLQRMLGPKP